MVGPSDHPQGGDDRDGPIRKPGCLVAPARFPRPSRQRAVTTYTGWDCYKSMGVNEMYARMFSLFYTVTVTSLAYIPFAYSGEATNGSVPNVEIRRA